MIHALLTNEAMGGVNLEKKISVAEQELFPDIQQGADRSRAKGQG